MTGREEGPSAAHDERVLSAARDAGSRIRARRRGRSAWVAPVALAAGLVLGMLVPGLPWRASHETARPTVAAPPLFVPATAVTRGASAATQVPVEQLSAEVWYRYIQELLLAGEIGEAERHLHRFVQLHPGYRPGQP
jgi:hypothetical protein